MTSPSGSSSKLCATVTPHPWNGRARALCAEGRKEHGAQAAVPL
jgi:hypothetical protein